MSRVYISGGITDVPEHKENFTKAEMLLKSRNHTVFNPVLFGIIYPFFDYEDYLKVDFTVLESMDAIYMLKGYEQSQGSMLELRKAKQLGLEIMYEGEDDSSCR